MKKTRLLLVFALFAFAYSCKKSDTAAPAQNDQPTYNVQFNVQNFQASYSDISSNTISTAGLGTQGVTVPYVNTLLYFVYDSLGNLVNRQMQNRSYSQDFGLITDKLQAGLYTFVIGASTKDTAFVNTVSNLNTLKVVCYSGWYDEGGQDIFLYKKQLRIGKSDTSFNNIQPSRLTGKLAINFKDSIPSEYKRMDVYIDSLPAYYNVATGTLTGQDFQKHSFSPYFSKGLVYYALGSNNGLGIKINGITQVNPETIGHKVDLSNKSLFIYPNKQTTLSGKFIDAQSVGLPVGIDTSYSGSINVDF